jgi:hypothetical protein
MDLDDPVRRRAGEAMEAVDVLRDQGVQRAAPLEVDQGAVPGVRIALARERLRAAAPGAYAHVPIGHVVLQRRHLLGAGVFRPHALRTAEVRNPRVGGDAGAGEHDDALGVGDPGTNRRDELIGHDWRRTTDATAWLQAGAPPVAAAPEHGPGGRCSVRVSPGLERSGSDSD